MHGKVEVQPQFSPEKLKGRDHLEGASINGRIILK
jgi:hypothetical protein